MTKPWTRWLFWLQCVLLAVMLGGMLANKFELVEFRSAFMGFVLAFGVMILVTFSALVSVLFVWWKKLNDHRNPALQALLLGSVPLAIIFTLIGSGLKAPAIHDVSTDLENPPLFIASYALRKAAENSLDIPTEQVRDQQRASYPDLLPKQVNAPVDKAFERALETCKSLGWSITAESLAEGRIEAVEATLFFGFKDDIVIRVSATETGSLVDVRSVSRVGVSDLGANAKRIRRFMDKFGS